MKRGIAFILICFFLLSLAGCMSERENLELPEADMIRLRSGLDGAEVDITDQEDIRRITENINVLKFEKGYSSKDYDGWSYSLTWYDSQGKALDSLTVMTGNRVSYHDFFYVSVGGGIDTPFFDQLLGES